MHQCWCINNGIIWASSPWWEAMQLSIHSLEMHDSFQIDWSSQILLSYMWILAHSPSSVSLKPLMGLCWVWCWIWIVYVHSTLEDNSVWPSITPIIRAMQTDTSVLHNSGQFTILSFSGHFLSKAICNTEIAGNSLWTNLVLAFPNQTWCDKIKVISLSSPDAWSNTTTANQSIFDVKYTAMCRSILGQWYFIVGEATKCDATMIRNPKLTKQNL